jgi:hypothetical protein
MQTMLHRQSISKQVAKAPACMSAYWSQFSTIGLGLGNNDRTPEINVGSLEGWDG